MNPTRYCGHGCPLHYGHFAALTADTGVRYPIRDHKRRSPCLPWRGRRPLAEQIRVGNVNRLACDPNPKARYCNNCYTLCGRARSPLTAAAMTIDKKSFSEPAVG